VLDLFFAIHHQVVFTNSKRISLEDYAFANAMTIAERSIKPPIRDMLENQAPHRRHEALYEFLAEEEMCSTEITPNGYLERSLYEVVILHKLIETESSEGQTGSINRSVAVLGGMIQSRLTRLLVELDEENALAILELCDHVATLNRNRWKSSIYGASAEAKVLIELGRCKDVRLYESSLLDDVQYGIDVIVETRDGKTGVCVSVKSRANQPGYLCLSPPPYKDLAQDWMRIKEGTTEFNEIFHRQWRPVLLQIGRPHDQMVNLSVTRPKWAMALRQALWNNEFVSTLCL
jgi:hypothetical protein